MSIFQAVLLQIDERHEVDWDAVKQVDIVTIGDDGDVNMVVTTKFQQIKVFDRWLRRSNFEIMTQIKISNSFLSNIDRQK